MWFRQRETGGKSRKVRYTDQNDGERLTEIKTGRREKRARDKNADTQRPRHSEAEKQEILEIFRFKRQREP